MTRWRPTMIRYGAWPNALALMIAAALVWAPRATWVSTVAGALGALGGGLLGGRLARSRLRGGVAPLAAAVAWFVAWCLSAWISRWPVPASGNWPELVSATLDAARVASASAAISLALVYVAQRVGWARSLPSLALVAAATLTLVSHRGGAIHLPHALSDPAWLRGWNPALAIAACGALAGLAGAAALYRSGRARGGLLQLALLALAALVFFSLAPRVGLFRFPNEDPLGLSKPATRDEPRVSRPVTRGQRPGRDGLPWRPSGDGLPWLDDYSGDGTGQAGQRPNPPVAVVILHEDFEPAGGYLYFRQSAFSVFNGAKLVRAADPRMDADLLDDFPSTGPARPAIAPSGASRTEVPTSVALIQDLYAPIALTDPLELRPQSNPDSSLFRRVYDVDSLASTAQDEEILTASVTSPLWPEIVRRTYLELPADDRYHDLADQIVSLIKPQYRDHPYARAMAVRYWLSENTKYSLRSKHKDAPDPAADFLFGDRIGYCVHLSHAAAYLLRAMNVPARVATGFAYHAEDRGNGSAILLRGSESHAWAEVFIAGFGWIPVDPSPENIDPPVPSPDIDLQRLLGELARPKTASSVDQSASRGRLPTLSEIAVGLTLLAAVATAIGWAIKLWRRWSVSWFNSDRRARRAYIAALDRLVDAGFVRADGETREAFAARVGNASPSFQSLTHVHLAAVFGKALAEPAQARALARQVGHDLALTGGWKRRTRSAHPYTWLWSR